MCALTPVYDDYGYFILGMASGQFSDFSFIDLHYLSFILVNHAYKFLYGAAPTYAWMGLALVASNFIGLGLLLRTVRVVIWNGERPVWVLRLLQATLAFFYLENFWILSHTRFALVFCGLALVNLAFAESLKKREIALWFLVFVWGMLHRPESALGMLALVPAGFLLYRFRPLFLLKRIALPLAAATVLFTCITVDRLNTDIYVRRVEPEIEYKMMDKRVIPPSATQTPADSVKYQAALMGMWFDTATLTPEYLRSIQLPGLNPGAAHAAEVLGHIGSFYGRYAFIPVWMVLALLWALGQKQRRVLLRLVLWWCFAFCLLFALDFNGLLVDGRHFLNLQLVALAVSAVYMKPLALPGKPVWAITAGLCLVAGTAFAVSRYVELNREGAQSVACYESFMQEAERAYQNQIVVVTVDNYNLLDHGFSVYNANYTRNTYIMYDLFTFSLIPEYMDYLGRLCHCNPWEPKAFYRWLAERKALYMAKPSRYALTERFMYVIHKQDLHFDVENSLGDLPCTKQSFKKGFEWRRVRVGNP